MLAVVGTVEMTSNGPIQAFIGVWMAQEMRVDS